MNESPFAKEGESLAELPRASERDFIFWQKVAKILGGFAFRADLFCPKLPQCLIRHDTNGI